MYTNRRSRIRSLLLEKQKVCQWCQSPHNLELDHIWAIGNGGPPSAKWNLQILCRSCNQIKGSLEKHNRGLYVHHTKQRCTPLANHSTRILQVMACAILLNYENALKDYLKYTDRFWWQCKEYRSRHGKRTKLKATKGRRSHLLKQYLDICNELTKRGIQTIADPTDREFAIPLLGLPSDPTDYSYWYLVYNPCPTYI
jgi:hypothetical protein